MYLGSNISSFESDVNIHIAKALSANDWFSVKSKSDISN